MSCKAVGGSDKPVSYILLSEVLKIEIRTLYQISSDNPQKHNFDNSIFEIDMNFIL